LQAFLNQHPELKEESAETPAYLMQREKRFDAQESRRAANPNPDLTRQEVATGDQFFDKNPNIDQDLRRNPSLVNNAEYLEAHPQLQSFLNQHPNVKDEISENPRYFMQRENRFDAREANRRDNDRDVDRDRNRNDADRDATARNDGDRDATARNDRDFDRDRGTDRDARRSNDVDRRSNPNPDLTNREVATMDDFLDRHQDVAKSLEKKPELINDHKYLKRHKDLDEFLSEHPAVREEVRENPSYFMRRENRFEARNMDRDVPDRDRDRGGDVDRDRARGDRDDRADADLNKKELRDMDHFLDKHKNIEKDLQKDPSLANDDKYLKKHKPLEAFLSKNPEVGHELKENPSAFMQKQERLQKMNNHQPMDKHKTKLEEKEQTHTATPH
jgi:phage-related protein